MPAAACTNCGQPLRLLTLAGHYGREVDLDVCAACHLVWFDPVESARLAGPGLLALVGDMAAAQALAHTPLRADLGCPRCGGGLKTVHNRTRHGRSQQRECIAGHGAWQTFGEFLVERGLLRTMSLADRHRALQQGPLACVACGGAIGLHDQTCPWCDTAPALVDVARLAQALDPEGATEGHPVHGTAREPGTRHCQACGAAQPPEPGWSCTHCGATLAALGLAKAHAAVAALAPALQAHASRPVPAVVQRRLQALQGGVERERARVAHWQAEADAAAGRSGMPWQDDRDTQALRRLMAPLPRHVQWTVVAALLALMLWLWW
jgi:ssDNA-binding Zn-finger/Zn-ribbon topoisomerase 1